MTNRASYKDHIDLIQKVKDRYEPGSGKPTLVQITREAGFVPESLTLKWMFYAGMGNMDLVDATKNMANAAKDLLEDGTLAPSAPFSYYNLEGRDIKLIEDLTWGLEANDNIVLYELGSTPETDIIIRPDAEYDKAIAKIQTRLTYSKALVDSPILVKDEQIRPIILDENCIKIRMRQMAASPTQP